MSPPFLLGHIRKVWSGAFCFNEGVADSSAPIASNNTAQPHCLETVQRQCHLRDELGEREDVALLTQGKLLAAKIARAMARRRGKLVLAMG